MQNSVPKGQGGMVAVLGSTIDVIEKILTEHKENLKVHIANDNSEGQIVLSGKTEDLEKLIQILKDNSINYLINMHPKFYRDNLKFEDWDSSMRFLQDKRQEAFNFWNHNGNW